MVNVPIKIEIIGKIVKSNSSYGNYSVSVKNYYNYDNQVISVEEVEFFWKKKDAIKFITLHNID